MVLSAEAEGGKERANRYDRRLRTLITVSDNGTGIEPKNMQRIFDSFFTTKVHGMGMGLSICRSIIETHDGSLLVSSGDPHGTVFQVILPTNVD